MTYGLHNTCTIQLFGDEGIFHRLRVMNKSTRRMIPAEEKIAPVLVDKPDRG